MSTSSPGMLQVDLPVEHVRVGPYVLRDVAHVAPVAPGDEAEHGVPVAQQLREHIVAPVHRHPRPDVAEDGRVEDVDPGVDRIREDLPPGRLLQEAHHPPLLVQDHHPVLQGAGDAVEGQGGHRRLLAMVGDDLFQVEVGQGVPADDQERLVQQRLGVLHAPRRAQGRILYRVVDAHPEVAAVVEVLLDHPRQVLQGHHHLGDSVPAQEGEDVLHHRGVHDGHHRLGAPDSQRTEPGALAPGHDDGLHGLLSSAGHSAQGQACRVQGAGVHRTRRAPPTLPRLSAAANPLRPSATGRRMPTITSPRSL